MQLEIGCSGNPLNKDYRILGHLATEGWVKVVWERALHYGYRITLDYPMKRLPREGDSNLVAIFTECGKQGKELVSLNWCRNIYHASQQQMGNTWTQHTFLHHCSLRSNYSLISLHEKNQQSKIGSPGNGSGVPIATDSLSLNPC
jgi:hypothetical protein